MTDTPAVVSLPFGLVLKCFFIFPATDNWWSFSHRPSSCTEQEERKTNSALMGKYGDSIDVSSINSVLTVTQGCSNTWRAVYLWSTSTSSMDRISSCSSKTNTGESSPPTCGFVHNTKLTQIFTLAVSDTLSQYGRGNSSCPIRIWSKSTSWSSLLLKTKHCVYINKNTPLINIVYRSKDVIMGTLFPEWL